MQGQTQGELNEKGREQARQVAERLASEQIDAVIASDLHRAVQTAEYIAQPHHLEVSFGGYHHCFDERTRLGLVYRSLYSRPER